MRIDSKSKFIIFILMLLLVSCASPSRYRVLVANKAGHSLEVSKYYYVNPIQVEGQSFENLFNMGQRETLKDGEWIHIKWPAIRDYNYFWIGIKASKGEHWVINQKFEEYGRYWFDISEGLRIDYIIEPSGEIKKKYWE